MQQKIFVIYIINDVRKNKYSVGLMKVQTVTYSVQRSPYTTPAHKKNPTETNKQPNVTFRGKPWILNPAVYGAPKYGEIGANDAIRLYEQLACGNYLDIGEDKWNFNECNRMREGNLAFLDRVVSTKEQEKFVEYYKRVTGFPDLQNVSGKIKGEFVHAAAKTQTDLKSNKFKVTQAGYDGVCSVGRGKAFR